MVNAQEWLNEEYPLEKRKGVIKLSTTKEDLEGELDLKDFTNLGELYLSGTKITSLNLTNCEKIVRIEVWGNKLSTLILPQKGEKIYCIDISDNKLTDLTIFESLVNCGCEELAISGNPFSGSLRPLRKLKMLGRLVVRKTNLDSGLEYLPSSVGYFACDGKLSKVLNKFPGIELFSTYDYKSWRKGNLHLVSNAQQIIHLEQYKEVFNLIKQSFSLQPGNFWWSRNELIVDILCNRNQAFRLWLDEKTRLIEKLKVENEQYYQSFIEQE